MAKCKNLRSGFGLEGDEMTDRERLIELMIEAKRTDPETGSFTDYLADYLIEHGVIVLPCKVGDTVYCPWAYDENKEIAFTEVESIKIYVNGRPLAFVEDWEIDMPMPTAFYPENFGKTVFLTREEAEKALKECE